jgi:hypothetical protein
MGCFGQAQDELDRGAIRRRRRWQWWPAAATAIEVYSMSAGQLAALTTTRSLTGKTAVVLCPQGTAMEGLAVSVEPRHFVAAVASVCRRADGSLTRTQFIGSPGEGTIERSACPTDSAVAVGLYGRSGDVVDAVGLRCRAPGARPADAPLRGGSGGTPRGPFKCRRHRRLVGLQGTVVLDYFGAPDLSSVTGVCAPGAPAPTSPTSV